MPSVEIVSVLLASKSRTGGAAPHHPITRHHQPRRHSAFMVAALILLYTAACDTTPPRPSPDAIVDNRLPEIEKWEAFATARDFDDAGTIVVFRNGIWQERYTQLTQYAQYVGTEQPYITTRSSKVDLSADVSVLGLATLSPLSLSPAITRSATITYTFGPVRRQHFDRFTYQEQLEAALNDIPEHALSGAEIFLIGTVQATKNFKYTMDKDFLAAVGGAATLTGQDPISPKVTLKLDKGDDETIELRDSDDFWNIYFVAYDVFVDTDEASGASKFTIADEPSVTIPAIPHSRPSTLM